MVYSTTLWVASFQCSCAAGFTVTFARADTDKLQSALTPTQKIALSGPFYSLDSCWDIAVVSVLTFFVDKRCSVRLFFVAPHQGRVEVIAVIVVTGLSGFDTHLSNVDLIWHYSH